MRSRFCGAFAQLKALAAAAIAIALLGASPAPASQPARVDVRDLQPRSLLPKGPLHTEFLVETNKLGQVTRVRRGKGSSSLTFNAQTYGNALQTFIRTDDGRAVAGTYRLTYAYDPKTERVHREVALVRAGGVDPNAKGAAADMEEKAMRHSPRPVATSAPVRLPDLPQVMKSPKP